jgi:Rrf2 family nitric oxide-sensitive transcriptional repressor
MARASCTWRRSVRSTEPNFALVECFATGNPFVITGCCRLPHVLSQALAASLDAPWRAIALKPKHFRKVLSPAE